MSGDPGATNTLLLGDIEVTYREEGQGPLVVLTHGLAQDHRMWRGVQSGLEGFRTISYDIRGHGSTTIGDADGTLAQMGGDLVNLLEHFGQATCVGFSLGGTVALWAAANRPDLVPNVFVAATSSVVGRAAAKALDERIELFASFDGPAFEAALREETEAQLGGVEVADLDGIIATRLEAVGNGEGYVNAARAMVAIHGKPLNPTLEQIRARVVVLTGEKDPFCGRRAAEIMLEYLPNHQFEELPGMPHLITDVDPASFTAVLEKRLDEQKQPCNWSG